MLHWIRHVWIKLFLIEHWMEENRASNLHICLVCCCCCSWCWCWLEFNVHIVCVRLKSFLTSWKIARFDEDHQSLLFWSWVQFESTKNIWHFIVRTEIYLRRSAFKPFEFDTSKERCTKLCCLGCQTAAYSYSFNLYESSAISSWFYSTVPSLFGAAALFHFTMLFATR